MLVSIFQKIIIPHANSVRVTHILRSSATIPQERGVYFSFAARHRRRRGNYILSMGLIGSIYFYIFFHDFRSEIEYNLYPSVPRLRRSESGMANSRLRRSGAEYRGSMTNISLNFVQQNSSK